MFESVDRDKFFFQFAFWAIIEIENIGSKDAMKPAENNLS